MSEGATVVVRRPGPRGEKELLVLHRAAAEAAGDGAWTSPSGACEPGETPYAAALRELAEGAGLFGVDVWAVDLSGPWALFGCDLGGDPPVELVGPEHDRFVWLDTAAARRQILPGRVAERQVGVAEVPRCAVTFRAMTRADLPDVVRWQAEPHVARWWSSEAADLAAAEHHYGPAFDGQDPTRMWVVDLDGRAAGFVQDYRIVDHPEYARLAGAPDAIGVDYALGEPGWVGRGVGTKLLWTYLRDIVLPGYPGAMRVQASPDHRNLASLRVLDKLGFTRGLWFDEPQPDGSVATLVGCTLDLASVLGRAPVRQRAAHPRPVTEQ